MFDTPLDVNRNFDGKNGWAQKPSYGFPGDHVNLDTYFLIAAPPAEMTRKVFLTHPNVDSQFKAKIAVPSDHPSITFPSGALPASHAKIDSILKNPALHPLPVWHPLLSSYVVYGQPAKLAIPISAAHPDIDMMVSAKESFPSTHPFVNSKFVGIVAASHPGYIFKTIKL